MQKIKIEYIRRKICQRRMDRQLGLILIKGPFCKDGGLMFFGNSRIKCSYIT